MRAIAFRAMAGLAPLVLALSACSEEAAPTPAVQASPRVETISVSELVDLVEKGEAQLVDVRTPEEYAAGHLAGAVNMPIDGFDPAALPATRGRETILYCRSGRRSEIAAERVAEYDMRTTRHLYGGILAWQEAGLPVTVPETGMKGDAAAD